MDIDNNNPYLIFVIMMASLPRLVILVALGAEFRFIETLVPENKHHRRLGYTWEHYLGWIYTQFGYLSRFGSFSYLGSKFRCIEILVQENKGHLRFG